MIDVLERAARAGGEVLRKYFQQEIEVRQKTSQHNIVTQADIEAQTVIHDTLLAGMIEAGYRKEEIGFIGEEEGVNHPAEYTFITDPLDGTNNFASGLDIFAVSIALIHEGQTQLGCVYDPIRDELYWARRGEGTFMKTAKGQRKVTLLPHKLSETLLLLGVTSVRQQREQVYALQSRLYPLFRERRMLGSIVQEGVFFLKGIFGALISWGPRIWDIAAIKLLIEEAGGGLVGWGGEEIELDLKDPQKPYRFIAAHTKNLEKILQIINK